MKKDDKVSAYDLTGNAEYVSKVPTPRGELFDDAKAVADALKAIKDGGR